MPQVHRPIDDSDGDMANWPIFVVGCHRSGTTLLRYLLDAHPRLACPPESKFMAALEAFFHYPQVPYALKTLGVKEGYVLEVFRRLADEIMRGYATGRGKHRWVDKTPNYYRILPFIDSMFRCQALYVYIVRHPFDTIESLERFVRRRKPSDPEMASALARYGVGRPAWAQYWREVNESILAFVSGHNGRVTIVRYEDLVCDPEGVMRRVLAFVQEDWCDGLVDRAFTTAHSPGYQDWTAGGRNAVYKSRVGKWFGWPQEETVRLGLLLGHLPGRWGYDLRAPTTLAPDGS